MSPEIRPKSFGTFEKHAPGADPAFFESGSNKNTNQRGVSVPKSRLTRYFLGGSGGMLPQKILKIWVLLHALWYNLERKISGFHIE